MPAGTRGGVIYALDAVIVKAVQKAEIRARLAQMGVEGEADWGDVYGRTLRHPMGRSGFST